MFYRDAKFYSADEVQRLLRTAGFTGPDWIQTLFKPLEETREIEAVRAGRDQGAFVVVKAGRP